MFKKYLVLFLMLLITALAQEEVIKIGAQYTEASARIEAFKNIKEKLDKDFCKQYLIDKNKKENLEAIKNKQDILKDKETNIMRQLCPFTMKDVLISYSITYEDKQNYAFYYDIFGRLLKIDVQEQTNYPKKMFAYSRNGKLISVIFEVSNEEQFIYNENGKLIAHWVGSEMKDKDNSIPKFFKIKRGMN